MVSTHGSIDIHRSSLLGLCALLALVWAGCSPDYPTCDTDEDCHEAEFCVNNLCQQCRGSEDCPAGQQCAAGACEAIQGYCTSNSQCGEGQECQNNVCVTAAQAELALPEQPVPDCFLQSVYFNYDSSTLEGSARDQLSNNAACIKENGISKLHLTGLTDPRGTEEYNMALGDRRARSAHKYMESLGVDSTVSYSSMGEELANGTDEATWTRDRRVDFKIR